jgi:MYXO-CTERM domain-containing protein
MRWLGLLACVGCGVDSTAIDRSPILGPAHPAATGEWPATGALLSNALGRPDLECTGTLIAPSVVLTAAHCVDSVATSAGIPPFTFARYAYSPPADQILSATAAVAHPMWHGDVPLHLDQANDLGLLFLAQPVTDIAPAVLPRPADAAAIATDLEVVLVGYGYNDGAYEEAGVPGYEYKMVGTSRLVATAAWEVQVAGPDPTTAGACTGDSGGPAYAMLGDATPRIAGTVSRGLAVEDCSKGGIYTRVDPYVGWIESQVTLPCNSGSSPACPGGVDAGVADGSGKPDGPVDPDHGPGGGCGCRTSGAPGPAVLLVGTLFRRRRRART